MLAAQPDQPAREGELALLVAVELPAEPGEVVVLAPRVVVAVLGARELVAAEQHRHPLRQEERRQEVALLAAAELLHRRVVRRPLCAAVPAAVVVRPVAVALPVRLVAL